MNTSAKKRLKASEFDRAFETGEDVTKHLDLKTLKISHPVKRINIDIPEEILEKVDQEASRIGVPRTSVLKLWIAERVGQLAR